MRSRYWRRHFDLTAIISGQRNGPELGASGPIGIECQVSRYKTVTGVREVEPLQTSEVEESRRPAVLESHVDAVVLHAISCGGFRSGCLVDVFFRLRSQSQPRTGHVEKRELVFYVSGVCGNLNAMSRMEPIRS
jgi:hypothetical protein